MPKLHDSSLWDGRLARETWVLAKQVCTRHPSGTHYCEALVEMYTVTSSLMPFVQCQHITFVDSSFVAVDSLG